MIPLMVDFTGQRVIIFGGGAVGARKAGYFAGEADIIVYSRSFHPDFQSLPVRREVLEVTGDSAQVIPLIRGSALVIAATSDHELNRKIHQVSRQGGIWCNVASGDHGDVSLPAKITGERYTLAISTHGSVPAISRFIREELQEMFPDLDEIIRLGEWIRTTYRSDQFTPGEYESILYQAIRDPNIRAAIREGQAQARAYVLENYAL